MIRKHFTLILLALNLALAAGLAYMWLDADGQPRNIHWQAPQAQKPELGKLALPAQGADNFDAGQFMAIVDRPLFSPSRKPPPPPPPPDAKPAYDPLNDMQLYGAFASGDTGGIMARIEGKIRRVHYGDKIGEWTLKKVKDREITLERGPETRVLNLAYVKGNAAPPRPSTAAAPVAGTAPPPAGGTQAQRNQEEQRERIRMLNEFRAKVGAPLLPMP